jgi:hypothetical protein
VLLHSDTHGKPIASITAAFLPSVTYLLTFPRIYEMGLCVCMCVDGERDITFAIAGLCVQLRSLKTSEVLEVENAAFKLECIFPLRNSRNS